MQFKQELISHLFDEAMPLVKKHYAETMVMDEESLNPSRSLYCDLESRGVTRCYTMRDDHRGFLLAGYCSLFVVPHMHYMKSWALQDLIYVEPDYRGFFARSFIRWIDDLLKKEGVDCISRGVHVKKDYSRTLVGLGYNKLETIFLKVL